MEPLADNVAVKNYDNIEGVNPFICLIKVTSFINSTMTNEC
ncbi:hypothetical protein GCM10007987_04160 [Aliivibrio fischeri]|nr:hypothetical protein GCM10007987_04160 [Aliivibrio fischeri]